MPIKRIKLDHSSPAIVAEERTERMKRSGGNQLKIKPEGNLLINPSHRSTRTQGLGNLAILSDQLLLTLFSHGAFEAIDLTRCRGVSKAFLGWVSLDSLWKLFYIKVRLADGGGRMSAGTKLMTELSPENQWEIIKLDRYLEVILRRLRPIARHRDITIT